MSAAHELDQRFNDSEEWRAWWKQTSLQRVKVGVIVNARESKQKIERGRKIAKADFEMDRSYFNDRDPDALGRLASEEASYIMSVIAKELRMTRPPALP